MIPALFLVLALSGQADLDAGLRHAAELERSGRDAAAREAYGALLPLAPPGTRERARILASLAMVESNLGDYKAAASHAREAADIYAAVQEPRGRASALNRAALAAMYAGDYHTAAATLETVAKLLATTGDDEWQAQQVISNLGNAFFFLGRYADAARSYDAALALADKHRDEAWAARRRHLALVNKATLFQRLGRDEEALALYREVGASGADLRPREQAQVLESLGVLYRRLGDPIKALATYDEALKLLGRERHVDSELGVMKNRGIVLALDLGQLDEARRSFSDALDRAVRAGNRREMIHARLYRGETLLRAGRADAARDDFQAALGLAGELKTPEEEWKALYGLGRIDLRLGRRVSAIAHFERAVTAIEALRETIRVPALRSDFFQDKREVYDALIAQRLHDATAAQLFELIERSRSRAWRERLGLTGSVDLAAIQRVLPPRALLLEYWSSPLGSALVRVSRTAAEAIPFDLEDAQVRALVDALAASPPTAWRAAAVTLAPRLLSGGLPQGVDRVIVVADGALALVPFEVLPVENGLLVERAAVTYMPTAALLTRAAPDAPAWLPPWRLQLRAFADPVFASATLDDPSPGGRPLASTAEEVRQVASRLGGAAALHLGRDNRKTHLLNAGAERAPVLHLATHARADTDALEQSRIVFSAADDSDGADYLFLKEAYELPLAGVEMAVLSACDTERGRLVSGEGVQSFSRAFLAAGARSTVTTLWRVADRPTAELMNVFYHHLQRGQPRTEALRLAKVRFLRSDTALRHPHYWAAFVMTGDGTRPIPRAVTWRALAVATAVAAGVIGVLLFRRPRRARRAELQV
jgi:tetratricopeptide (TPR) repeat protein